MFLKVCLIIFSTLTVISFVSTCSEENIIAKLSQVNKNKGVADYRSFILMSFHDMMKQLRSTYTFKQKHASGLSLNI